MRILIVEDDKNLQMLYRDELSEEGYEVHIAGSAAEAWHKFLALDLDFVTMDIQLPDFNGKDLLRRMRELKPEIPALFLTAYDFFDDSAVWMSDDFVIKSSDLSELKQRIQDRLKTRLVV